MRYQVILPSPELSRHVKFFWTLEAELDQNTTFPHRLFADACPTIVFHYKNTFNKVVDGFKLDRHPLSILHGHTKQFEDMSVKGSFGIFGVYLFPLSIGSLFGYNPSHLRDNTVSLQDLLNQEGMVLEEQIITAMDNAHRVRIASEFFINRIRKIEKEDELMTACIGEFLRTKGNDSIGYLAENSGWTTRHLERRFSSTMGLSPKLYSRIVRFQNTITNYERGSIKSLSDLAYISGFFDQSHLIREFRSFAGMSPKEYFRNSPEIAEGFAQLAV